MGLRFYRRQRLGGCLWAALSGAGPSFGRTGKRVSWSVNRRGVGGSIRLLKGLRYVFGRR